MEFEIYKKWGGQYYWRLKADNNEIVASGEGYTAKGNCKKVVELLKSVTTKTPVIDLTKK